MSNRQIHVNREGQIYGPLQESTAHEMLESGQLLATDLAWFAGAAEWKPLREVLGPTPTVSAAAFSQNTVTSEPDIRPIPDFGAFIKEYEELEKYRTASPLNNIEGGEQQNQKLASLISRCRGYLQDLVRYAGENQQNAEVLQDAQQRIAQYIEDYETHVLVDGTKLNPLFEALQMRYFRDKVFNPAIIQKSNIEKLLAAPTEARIVEPTAAAPTEARFVEPTAAAPEPAIRPMPDFAEFAINYNSSKGADRDVHYSRFVTQAKYFIKEIKESIGKNQNAPGPLQKAKQLIDGYLAAYDEHIVNDLRKKEPENAVIKNIHKVLITNNNADGVQNEINDLLKKQQTADGSGRPGTKKYPIKAIAALVVAILLAGAMGYYYHQQSREVSPPVKKVQPNKNPNKKKPNKNNKPPKKNGNKKPPKENGNKKPPKKNGNNKPPTPPKEDPRLKKVVASYFGEIAEGKTNVRIIYPALNTTLHSAHIPLLRESLLSNIDGTEIMWGNNGFLGVDWTRGNFGMPLNTRDFIKPNDSAWRPRFDPKGRFAALRTQRRGETEILYLCNPNTIPIFGEAFSGGLDRVTPGGDPLAFKEPLGKALKNVEVILSGKKNAAQHLKEHILFPAHSYPLDRFPYYRLKGNIFEKIFSEEKREKARELDKTYRVYKKGSTFPIQVGVKDGQLNGFSPLLLKGTKIEFLDFPDGTTPSEVIFDTAGKNKKYSLDQQPIEIKETINARTVFRISLQEVSPEEGPSNIKIKITSNPKVAKEYIEQIEKQTLANAKWFFYAREHNGTFLLLARFPRTPSP